MEEELIYLVVGPDGNLDVARGPLSNSVIHQHIGGYFEILNVGPQDVMLVDSEGKMKRKEPNNLATALMGELFSRIDVIVGTVIIVGTEPPEFCNVSALPWEKLTALTDGLLPWPEVMATVSGVGSIQTKGT